MKDTIVLYTVPAMGHLVSLVELGKLILRHYNQRFSLTVLISGDSFKSAAINPYIDHVSHTDPLITFHRLPALPNPPSLPPSPTFHPVAILLESIRLNNPNLLQTLQTISETSSVAALVIDFFCHPASPVATELNIPLYYYFPSGASSVAMMLHLPNLHNQTNKSFRELGNTTVLQIPGLPPIRATEMGSSVLDRTNQVYDKMLDLGTNLLKSKGIITNTIEALEPKAINAIRNQAPAIFCVGPLLAEPKDQSGAADCLSWLDKQPSRSVIFLCFGSLGAFSVKQIAEIAVGLERSGQRFLWVVKNPPPIGGGRMQLSAMDFDLEALMPEGFLERTSDRGLVVKSWAPQVEVLSRESVGGFVTHCGWNSVLEAVCAGMPMVAWPLYAEQPLNKKVLVEEMRVALPMEAAEEDGFVIAAEVEKRVRMLIDSEEGREISKRCREMKEKALAAWAEGGSSRTAFAELAESWNRG
ncbi:UDP-glycosyltransferase 88F3-like [Telopea speciosissima]|uniref:UDP-glycosyltransferase 88F3-like n=1 Tax=Telopea speciosissima TaxID=54955 RepID=UPI001CC369E7|nr:UDP-glycosyltransferase 88F3-like [Telopea speciosissima]